MLFRFSLYGFLKNQQYYEPFLILAFREKGLSFFQIGLLIGFREIMINLFEVPSGIVADLYGRRRSMIFSFSAYIASFIFFALSRQVWQLFPAMLLFALGEAFRTGTHKAMIFHWLKLQNRLEERTKIYGFTRSWSKFGSAISALIAGTLVFYSGRYSSIFWFSVIPYTLGIINFLGYPKELDLEIKTTFSIRDSFKRMLGVIRDSFKNTKLRRIYLESMGFSGYFNVSKDYLQPILKSLALGLPIFVGLGVARRSAVVVALVYFTLYLFSSLASRYSHVLSGRLKGEENASRFLWKTHAAIFGVLAVALVLKQPLVAALGFVAYFTLQNFWEPILYARIDKNSKSEMGATVLSIDQQVESLFSMIAAPILGLLVDHLGFGPVGVLGLLMTLIIMGTGRGR
jgi:MFS family permease